MAKYDITVEIPNGPYCFNYHANISCHYQGDAHVGAGYCSLITEGDSILQWKDKEKEKYEEIIKHPKCPSLQPK